MSDTPSLGLTLRAARERLHFSQSEVAEATRIKLNIIQDLENNDFSHIAAPLYGKGFIKLYAEHVGLDPEPLAREYVARYARPVRPSLNADSGAAPLAVPPGGAPALPVPPPVSSPRVGPRRRIDWSAMTGEIADALRSAANAAAEAFRRLREPSWPQPRRTRPSSRYGRGAAQARLGRNALIVAGVLLLGALAVFGTMWLAESRRTAAVPVQPAAPGPLRLAEEPPAPYLKPAP